MTEIDYAEVARAAGLKPVGKRPRFGAYLAEVWRRRHFAFAMAQYGVEVKHVRNRLGVVWMVLRPMLMASIYGLVFGLIMPRDTRPLNFMPYLFVGVFIFEFFSKSLSDGAKSITGNASLVASLRFPRMLLPLSAVYRNLIELVPVIVILLPIIMVFGEMPRWSWLMLPVVIAVMTVFNTGVALFSARLTVHLRDVSQILPFITRLLFYGSGIFFSLENVFASRPEVLAILQFNPVYAFITLARAYTVSGVEATPVLWLICGGWSLVALVVGVIFFWRAEERYARD